MPGPRTKSPRVLKYRSQVKLASWSLRAILSFSLFEILLSQITNFTAILDGTPLSPISTSDLAFILGTLIVYLVERWLNQLSRTEIQAFSDHLLIRTGSRTEKVYFTDIQTLSGRSSPGLGGWLHLMTKEGKSYRFTMVLERIDYILDAIIARRPDLLPEAEFKKLRIHLVLSDHNSARLYDFFSSERRPYTLTYLLGLPGLTVLFLGFQSHEQIRLWQLVPALLNSLVWVAIGSLILALPAVILSNLYFSWRFLRDSKAHANNKMRDLAVETRVYRRIMPMAWVISILFLVAFSKSGFIAVQRYAVENPNPSEKETTSLWVDIRKLLPGEANVGTRIVVRIQGRFLVGKIVGHGGDMANVHQESQGIRKIARESAPPELVPEGHLAVQISGSEEILVTPEGSIVGRPLKELGEFLNAQTSSDGSLLHSSNAQENDTH